MSQREPEREPRTYLGTFVRSVRDAWSDMLEPPWHDTGTANDRGGHWLLWVAGWVWSIAGLLLGSLVAPALLQFLHLQGTDIQNEVVIAVAVLAGFIVQMLGWAAVIPFARYVSIPILNEPLWRRRATSSIFVGRILFGIIAVLDTIVVILYGLCWVAPLALVGYGIFRYLTWVGAGQRSVTIALVGGAFVKLVLIPGINAAVHTVLFVKMLNWIRKPAKTPQKKRPHKKRAKLP